MRAVVLTATGEPEVLVVTDVAEPTLGVGEVLVRTDAAGVHFVETQMRAGLFPIPTPHVFGTQAAGEIVDVGRDVDRDWIGVRVIASIQTGAYAEYQQVWADRRNAYEYLPTDDEHWQTAVAMQRELASVGTHRAVGIADLLTAVIAARHRLVVVHYDADFEIAASVLDFNHQWVGPSRQPRAHVIAAGGVSTDLTLGLRCSAVESHR